MPEWSSLPILAAAIEGDLETQKIVLSTAWHVSHRRSRWHHVEETATVQT